MSNFAASGAVTQAPELSSINEPNSFGVQETHSTYPLGAKIDENSKTTYTLLFIKHTLTQIFNQLRSIIIGFFKFLTIISNNKNYAKVDLPPTENSSTTDIYYEEIQSTQLSSIGCTVKTAYFHFTKTPKRSINELSEKVQATLKKKLEEDPTTLLILIGTSMGGLVVRNTDLDSLSDRVIKAQINAPNYGAPPLALFSNKDTVFFNNFHPNGPIAQQLEKNDSVSLRYVSRYDALLPLTKEQLKDVEESEDTTLLNSSHSGALAHNESLEIIANDVNTIVKSALQEDQLNEAKTKVFNNILVVGVHGLNGNPGQLHSVTKKIINCL